MNENETVGMSIKILSEQAEKSIEKVRQQMKALNAETKSFQRTVKSNGKVTYTLFAEDSAKRYKTTINEVGKIISSSEKTMQKFEKTSKSSFNLGKLYLYWNMTKRIRDTIKGWVINAIDFEETTNKFNVAMGSSIKHATKFQNKLAEAFGTARTEMMNYQSTFKNILGGLGDMPTESSEKISESLVKMGLDYSSLFNVSQQNAMNKFQAALVGSIMPIRRDSGYDVSRNAVAAKAQDLGIERTYNQLNETEKRLIRIMLLMEQIKRTGAFNDLARTIESPANQIKVLKNQLQELGIWLGNVFVGTIGRILPYINGFVMVLKELAKMLALFVGYSPTTTGMEEAFETGDNATANIAGNLGSASKRAKELKKTLMGFDVLNVITTPTPSSGGGGGGGLPPVDPKILDALKEYDSLMEGVRMKAIDVRDKLMDWLGFTQEINPETGEITWKLRKGYQNIEKIRDVIEGIVFFLIGKKVLKLIKGFIPTDTDLSMLGKLKEGFKNLAPYLGGLTIAIGIVTTVNGIMSEDPFEQLAGSAETGMGAFLLAFSKYGWKTSLGFGVAVATFTLALSATLTTIKYSFEHLEENANELYGDIEKLTVWQKIHTFLYGMGEGVGVIFLDGIFGEGTYQGIIDGVAKVMEEIGKLGIDLKIWWEFDVAPWFTKERWQQLGEDVKQSLKETLEDYFEKLEPIRNWYENKVAPWFTREKWEQIADDARKGIENKLNDFAYQFNPIRNWWDNNIAPWFSWTKWKQLGQDAVSGMQSAFDNFQFKIKKPHLSWGSKPVSGWIGDTLSALSLPSRLPTLNVTWKANGGFANTGEMFIAREAGPELVGKIGNRSAVLNNNQIIDGVSQGVANAVRSVLGNQNNGGTYQFYLDSKQMTDVIQKRMNRNANIVGA